MGRQLAYDRENLLEQVMHVFWRCGYQATSISQLVEVTRVKPGSLYHGFDNKRGLLLASLEHYGQQSLARARRALEQEPRFPDAVRAFLQVILESSDTQLPGRGCFLVTTWMELAAHDDEVRQVIERNLKGVERLFEEAAQRAIQRQELPATRPPEVVAKTVMTMVWGLRMLRSTNPPNEQLRTVHDQLLRALDAP